MMMGEAESLHRLIKQAMDSGRAKTVEEAEALFSGYRLSIAFDWPGDSQAHAALLTCVALASRVFLGGVTVTGNLDLEQRTRLPFSATLREAVAKLGGQEGETPAGTPTITIGGQGPSCRRAPFHVRAVFAGWRGGVLPIDTKAEIAAAPVMALAPMLA